MKYCRYCSFCICGDCYYCTAFDKVLNRVDRATNCESFALSEMGDVDTGKPYKPREPKVKEAATMQQTSLFISMNGFYTDDRPLYFKEGANG